MNKIWGLEIGSGGLKIKDLKVRYGVWLGCLVLR